MKHLKYTGERYIPGQAARNVAEDHLRRYRHVRKLIQGKKVLDVACGSGYGIKLLSSRAAGVVGVDNSFESVNFASRKYLGRGSFVIQADAASLPLKDSSFEAVVSFETIEHIKEPKRFLQEIKRVLIPDGLLVISTPMRKGQNFDDFHLYEFSIKEFVELLACFFKVEMIEGQRLMFTPLFKLFSYQLVSRLKRISLVKSFFRRCYGQDEIKPLSSGRLYMPNFLIVTGINEK